MKTKVRKPRQLPRVLVFDRHGPCFWASVAFRAPKAGEFFVSGALPTAYLAGQDLSGEYQIVKPTFKARLVQRYVKGDYVK
jgi:hypothetical protein